MAGAGSLRLLAGLLPLEQRPALSLQVEPGNFFSVALEPLAFPVPEGSQPNLDGLTGQELAEPDRPSFALVVLKMDSDPHKGRVPLVLNPNRSREQGKV